MITIWMDSSSRVDVFWSSLLMIGMMMRWFKYASTSNFLSLFLNNIIPIMMSEYIQLNIYQQKSWIEQDENDIHESSSSHPLMIYSNGDDDHFLFWSILSDFFYWKRGWGEWWGFTYRIIRCENSFIPLPEDDLQRVQPWFLLVKPVVLRMMLLLVMIVDHVSKERWW